jgi:hypothetical protein
VQPYVVRQGDFMDQLASRYGFDGDAAWNDGSNDGLRRAGRLPNQLFPGDKLSLPDPTPLKAHALTVGSMNTFTAPAPTTTTIGVKFISTEGGASYASKAFFVSELPELTDLSTTGEGVATFDTPVTLSKATIVFSETGETWVLAIGAMDPMTTLSGIFKRLQNLGYIAANIEFDRNEPSSNLPTLRNGLLALKESEGRAPESSPPSGSPDSSPPSADAGGDDNASASAAASGLSDDGTLDGDTADLLKDAHGC